MFKKIIRNLLPPIVTKLFCNIKTKIFTNEKLFDGDERLFKTLFKDVKTYGEYGCGASTIWVAQNCDAVIYSTDSSEAWTKHVVMKLAQPSNLNMHYSDVGEISDWGRPIGYSMRDSFSDYTDWIWQQGSKPDLVLIDGRFRVCCFLTSLLNANEGTKIVFDDYANRPYYHIVEEFVPVQEFCGRQALFIVPNKQKLDTELIKGLIHQFRYVMD